MKLLSPLADKWDEGRATYRWATLEEMARMIKLEFADAVLMGGKGLLLLQFD